MELKDFIKTAITDITNAISELQQELNNGTVVSPSFSAQNVTTQDGTIRPITEISFDIAVTIGQKESVGAGAKAGISIFSAGINGADENKTENVSRMSFSIPLIYPTAKVKTDQEKDDAENQNCMSRQLEKALAADAASASSNQA